MISDLLDARARPCTLKLMSRGCGKMHMEVVSNYEPSYMNGGFTSGIAGFLGGMLERVDRPLNGESSRHLLLFSDGMFLDFVRN